MENAVKNKIVQYLFAMFQKRNIRIIYEGGEIGETGLMSCSITIGHITKIQLILDNDIRLVKLNETETIEPTEDDTAKSLARKVWARLAVYFNLVSNH